MLVKRNGHPFHKKRVKIKRTGGNPQLGKGKVTMEFQDAGERLKKRGSKKEKTSNSERRENRKRTTNGRGSLLETEKMTIGDLG